MDNGYGPVKFPVSNLDLAFLDSSTDIHPHTSYTDGDQEVQQSVDEARKHGVWEKGAIEHGNPVDEDISHLTPFLTNYDEKEDSYTSEEVFTLKYRNLEEIAQDNRHITLLNEADHDKLREDIETLREVQYRGEATLEDLMNYKMVIPHGVELDYNPAIEAVTDEDKQEAVDSYEEGLIDFLKEAERLNSGFNYALLSSHYVNTPFQPRYVKKDGLFEDMSTEEKKAVLDAYREKEAYKIESLSEKLGDMKVPESSEELMSPSELDELEAFIYDQGAVVNSQADVELDQGDMLELTEDSLDIERPGVVAVGAHPTLIERNEELMDVFREEEGLTTREDVRGEVESFIYDTDIEGMEGLDLSSVVEETVRPGEIDEMLSDEDLKTMYPAKSLLEFYRPVVDVAYNQDNFIFEINGKGVERQTPSVFWYMLDEKLFGSDAHRPLEQPERSQEYSRSDLPGETKLFAEKWLEQLEKDENEKESSSDLTKRIAEA